MVVTSRDAGNKNKNNNTNICKAHIVSIRAESEVPKYLTVKFHVCERLTAMWPYLTLPYHTGKTFYRLSLRPLNGPNAHPRISRKVTKSPSAVLTWVHTNTWNHPPPKRGPTHLNLLTNMHSWYFQENISSKAHKHIHPGHHDQQDSKPGCLLPVY